MTKIASNPASPSVLVIGSGEAFDSGVGNTSYLLRGKGLPTVLFDCGYQIPERLWKAGLHTGLDAVCFTHLHADHSFGIVPLLVRYAEEGRKRPFNIIGPRGTERFVLRLLDMGYPGFLKRIAYPIQFFCLAPGSPLKFRDLTFTCAPTVHSVLNYTVRVDLRKKRSFAVSGDGQITPDSKRLVHDVKLLFQEVYSEKPGIPVHADFETVAEWIPSTQIQRVVTSHFCRNKKADLTKRTHAKAKGGTTWIVSRPDLEFTL